MPLSSAPETSMAEDNNIEIEVAYARPDAQVLLVERVAAGTTVETAIRQSGVLERFPEIDLSANKVGIFGKLTKLDQTLRNKDRIEIYRPLIADPKESRRKRADKKSGKSKDDAQGGADTAAPDADH
ncbi:MAG: RnfH family protein [Pseudomonadota bacterium]|nr:MAG: RnfH family protein [Pseudomonadota bacterium]